MRRPRPLPDAKIGLFLTPVQSELLAYAIERACSYSKVLLDRERLATLDGIARQLADAALEAKSGGLVA